MNGLGCHRCGPFVERSGTTRFVAIDGVRLCEPCIPLYDMELRHRAMRLGVRVTLSLHSTLAGVGFGAMLIAAVLCKSWAGLMFLAVAVLQTVLGFVERGLFERSAKRAGLLRDEPKARAAVQQEGAA